MQPMQLSTFDSSTNRPSNRSVIFQGFLSVEQIFKNPGYEICWWFPSTNNQLRLSGNAYIIHPTNYLSLKTFPPYIQLTNTYSFLSIIDWERERIKYWENLSFEVKQAFYVTTSEKSLGGKIVIDKIDKGEDESAIVTVNTEKSKLNNDIKKVTDLKVHKNMCLIILEVDEVDRLDLSVLPNKRTRWNLVKDDDDNKIKWLETAIFPIF